MNQFISGASRNKVDTNKSWFAVPDYVLPKSISKQPVTCGSLYVIVIFFNVLLCKLASYISENSR